MKIARVISRLSLYEALLTIALAAGWLLPNHYAPWLAFHSNAWTAIVLIIVALWILITYPSPIKISITGFFLIAVSTSPWFQHWAGILPLPSTALLASLYLFGFATAFLLGEHWGRANPGQPATVILIAALIASIISVGLAIYQWLGLTHELGLQDIWVLHLDNNSRPYANLGQPNQLASLLLWGLLGVGWIWHRRWIGPVGAGMLAAFILLGVALTESRTALLTLSLGIAALSIRKVKLLDMRSIRAMQGLYLYYLFCVTVQAPIGRLIGLDTQMTMLVRSSGELRLPLWSMALDAATANPWFGLGWGRANEGFFQVFLNHSLFANLYFDQSHNLLLDLILWIGWPLGLGLIVCATLWMCRTVRSISNTEQMLTIAALGVMLIHAMLEFPLHYGYFLWPFGVLAGSVAANINKKVNFYAMPRKIAMPILVVFFCTICVLISDYLEVEESFTELRFQILHIGSSHNVTPPETILLTDWPKVISLARATPRSGMLESEIEEWKALAIYNTSPLAFRKVIGALTLNGHNAEAKAWADRTCFLLQQNVCKTMLNEWLDPAPAPSQSGNGED